MRGRIGGMDDLKKPLSPIGGTVLFVFCLAWSVGVAWCATYAIIVGEWRGKPRHDGKPQPVTSPKNDPVEFWTITTISYTASAGVGALGINALRRIERPSRDL